MAVWSLGEDRNMPRHPLACLDREFQHAEPLSADGALVLAAAGSRATWVPARYRHSLEALPAPHPVRPLGVVRACGRHLCSGVARAPRIPARTAVSMHPAPSPAAACLGAEAPAEATSRSRAAGCGTPAQKSADSGLLRGVPAPAEVCWKGRSDLEDL